MRVFICLLMFMMCLGASVSVALERSASQAGEQDTALMNLRIKTQISEAFYETLRAKMQDCLADNKLYNPETNACFDPMPQGGS